MQSLSPKFPKISSYCNPCPHLVPKLWGRGRGFLSFEALLGHPNTEEAFWGASLRGQNFATAPSLPHLEHFLSFPVESFLWWAINAPLNSLIGEPQQKQIIFGDRPYMTSDGRGGGGVQPNLIL